jgi:hypothetical protein
MSDGHWMKLQGGEVLIGHQSEVCVQRQRIGGNTHVIVNVRLYCGEIPRKKQRERQKKLLHELTSLTACTMDLDGERAEYQTISTSNSRKRKR